MHILLIEISLNFFLGGGSVARLQLKVAWHGCDYFLITCTAARIFWKEWNTMCDVLSPHTLLFTMYSIMYMYMCYFEISCYLVFCIINLVEAVFQNWVFRFNLFQISISQRYPSARWLVGSRRVRIEEGEFPHPTGLKFHPIFLFSPYYFRIRNDFLSHWVRTQFAPW